jgi:hypothetical protein
VGWNIRYSPSLVAGGSSDPYPLYTSFNRNDVPWHTASGAWGASVPIQAPTLPTTTRNVSVTSASQFETEAAVNGTRITITSGWSQLTNVAITGSDIDVIINPGVTIGAVQLGSYPYTDPMARIRLRGPTPGTKSGGMMGQYRGYGLATDVVFDGINMNGASDFGGGSGLSGEDNQAFRPGGELRMAVMNCCVTAGGYLWLGGQGTAPSHVLIANCNMFHGAATRAAIGYPEGEGIRNHGGPLIIVDSRIQGTRYHGVRMHSEGNSGELFYMARSTLVSQNEGKLMWLWNTVPTGHTSLGQGAYIDNCDFYSYQNASCGSGPAEIDASDVQYSRIRNCRTYTAGTSTSSQSYFNSQAAAGGGSPGNHDWSVNNSFASYSSYPAWSSVGDPTALTLPAGLTFADGEGTCPYGP